MHVGFFSTSFDRVASGCSPSEDESSYRDYASYFFAALQGVDRLGRKVLTKDHDNNGDVSFLEAHAYALAEGHSIDVGILTSDIFFGI